VVERVTVFSITLVGIYLLCNFFYRRFKISEFDQEFLWVSLSRKIVVLILKNSINCKLNCIFQSVRYWTYSHEKCELKTTGLQYMEFLEGKLIADALQHVQSVIFESF
jgi:hypothetical protein